MNEPSNSRPVGRPPLASEERGRYQLTMFKYFKKKEPKNVPKK